MHERNGVKICQQRKKTKSTTTGVKNSKKSFKSDNQESSFSSIPVQNRFKKLRGKYESTTTGVKSSKKSFKSDNQESSFSSIPVQNRFKKLRGKYESTSPKMKVTRNSQLQINSKGIQNNLQIPENVAIHFGNYYGLHEGSLEKNSQNKTNTYPRDPQFSAYSHNKTQFTWQMVYKLESCAGKQNYAKEVSALLEGTVEPPNFKINLPPHENCIPNGKYQASYPLWYKDAKKLLFSKNRYGRLSESYEELTSHLSKNEGKNNRKYEKVLKKERKENYEDLESLEGESNSEEGSSRTQEKEAHSSTSLSKSASCSESTLNSNLTSGFSSVTGKSATGSTSTMKSTSDSEDDDEDEAEEGDDDSASSSLSRSLVNADNKSQGVNVPVVAL